MHQLYLPFSIEAIELLAFNCHLLVEKSTWKDKMDFRGKHNRFKFHVKWQIFSETNVNNKLGNTDAIFLRFRGIIMCICFYNANK